MLAMVHPTKEDDVAFIEKFLANKDREIDSLQDNLIKTGVKSRFLRDIFGKEKEVTSES